MSPSTGVIFVHGVLSTTAVWRDFIRLIEEDPQLAELKLLTFGYSSPKLSLHPLRRIPTYNNIADSLRTFTEVEAGGLDRLVFVTHSQGGLITQRYLARMLMDGRGHELRRISRVVMFACPNSGSQLGLTLRRFFLRTKHPQERELRPLNELVVETQRVVVNRIVHATAVTDNSCPIPIVAYAGIEDNVVTPQSAMDIYPLSGALPGDHSSIVRPASPEDRSYSTLRAELMTAMATSPFDAQMPGEATVSVRIRAKQIDGSVTGIRLAGDATGPSASMRSEMDVGTVGKGGRVLGMDIGSGRAIPDSSADPAEPA